MKLRNGYSVAALCKSDRSVYGSFKVNMYFLRCWLVLYYWGDIVIIEILIRGQISWNAICVDFAAQPNGKPINSPINNMIEIRTYIQTRIKD